VIIHYSATDSSIYHESSHVQAEGREGSADANIQLPDGVVLYTIRNSTEKTITLVGRSPAIASTRVQEKGRDRPASPADRSGEAGRADQVEGVGDRLAAGRVGMSHSLT